MKRNLALGWLVLLGLTGLALAAIWLTEPTGTSFWYLMKGLSGAGALAAPAIRYLRKVE